MSTITHIIRRIRRRFALLPDWRAILIRAWSARLMWIAIVLSGVEVVLPIFSDSIPRGPFAIASFFATAGALWARLVYQPTLRPDDGDNKS